MNWLKTACAAALLSGSLAMANEAPQQWRLRDGRVIEGTVAERQGALAVVQCPDGSKMAVDAEELDRASTSDEGRPTSRFSLGMVGRGMGLELDLPIASHVSLIAGAEVNPLLLGIGGYAGVRAYLDPSRKGTWFDLHVTGASEHLVGTSSLIGGGAAGGYGWALGSSRWRLNVGGGAEVLHYQNVEERLVVESAGSCSYFCYPIPTFRHQTLQSEGWTVAPSLVVNAGLAF